MKTILKHTISKNGKRYRLAILFYFTKEQAEKSAKKQLPNEETLVMRCPANTYYYTDSKEPDLIFRRPVYVIYARIIGVNKHDKT
jgi:ferredoxin-like protein FixX